MVISHAIFIVGVIKGVVLGVSLVTAFSVDRVLLGLVVTPGSLLRGGLVHLRVVVVVAMRGWGRLMGVRLVLVVVDVVRGQRWGRLQVIGALVVVRLGRVVLVGRVGVVAGVLDVGHRLGAVLMVVGVLRGRALQVRQPHLRDQHSALGPAVPGRTAQANPDDRQNQQHHL